MAVPTARVRAHSQDTARVVVGKSNSRIAVFGVGVQAQRCTSSFRPCHHPVVFIRQDDDDTRLSSSTTKTLIH